MSNVYMNIDVDINFLFFISLKILINVQKSIEYKNFRNSSVAEVDCAVVSLSIVLNCLFRFLKSDNHNIRKIYFLHKDIKSLEKT